MIMSTTKTTKSSAHRFLPEDTFSAKSLACECMQPWSFSFHYETKYMPNAFQELITSEGIIIPWHIFSYTCWKQQRQIFQTSTSLLSTKDVHRSLRVEVILHPIHLIHSMAFLVLEGTSFVEHMTCTPHGCCHVFRELVLQFFLNPRAETNNLSKNGYSY